MAIDITDKEIENIIDNVCKSVGGAISVKESEFLCKKATEVKKGVIVEIGAAFGRSSISMAFGCRLSGNGVKVYSIDPQINDMYTMDQEWIETGDPCKGGTPNVKYYTGQGTHAKKFLDNIKKWNVEDIVIPIIDYSELAYKNGLIDENGISKEWDLPIGLLFIDGDHRLNYVLKDIELWAKHVVDGGKIIFHDYPYVGVCTAVEKLIFTNPRYTNFKGVGVEEIVNVTVRNINEKGKLNNEKG